MTSEHVSVGTISRPVFATSPAGLSWLDLAPVPEAVRDARRFVADLLHGCEPAWVQDVVVVVSELVTNSIRAAAHHAPDVVGAIRLGVQLTDRVVHLHVQDPSPTIPSPATADLLADRGRGLELVETLCAGLLWFEAGPTSFTGKTGHAVLTVPGAELTHVELARLRPATAGSARGRPGPPGTWEECAACERPIDPVSLLCGCNDR